MFGRTPAADNNAVSEVFQNRIDELKSPTEKSELGMMADGPLAMPEKLRQRTSGGEVGELTSVQVMHEEHHVPKRAGVKETVISSDLIIQGNVLSKGTVRLQGIIVGDMNCLSLIVEEEGTITGNITAEKVNVYGRVEGTVRGVNVMLHSSAFVEGDIYHQGIGIEMGTHYDGRLQWDRSGRSVLPGEVVKANETANDGQHEIYAEAAE